MLEIKSSPAVVITREQALQRGLPGVTIRVDAVAAGMFTCPLPDNDCLALLSGPPGGPLSVMIWAASSLEIESEIRTRFEPIMAPVEIGDVAEAQLLGERRTGRVFRTGFSYIRMSWFAALVEVPAGVILIALGAGATTPGQPDVDKLLSHPSLSVIVRTLLVE